MAEHTRQAGRSGSPGGVKLLGAGQDVGRYRVVRTLGAGGMGVIYEATHPVLDTRLVIKTLRPELGTNPRLVDRFRTEALAASRLRDERHRSAR
jgi:serine/threonine protein kinase